jgi:hypothetical protein
MSTNTIVLGSQIVPKSQMFTQTWLAISNFYHLGLAKTQFSANFVELETKYGFS